MRRVFVTGLGVVSSIGIGVEENIASLKAEQHGMGKVTLFPTELNVPVSEVKQTNEGLKQLLHLPSDKTFSRTTLLGMLAAKEALQDAKLHSAHSPIGFISGTSVGGMDRSEHFYTSFKENPKKGKLRDIISHDCAASTEGIAAYIQATGYTTTLSTACTSAANAIMLGARLIRQGKLDTVVVGGTDALCRFTLNGFHSLMILDKEHCCPFDEQRAGLNLGEGAGYLVLQAESVCQRTPYCELTGYANANDAYHQTGSSPKGDGSFFSMSQAIGMSEVEAKEIDYINVHGTGTPGNDAAESHALLRLFGKHVPPFSSVKSFIGHTLGASQGIEAVYAVLSISRGMTYSNLNFGQPIGVTGLMPETSFKEGLSIRHVLCNSSGFGGNSTSLLFSAPRALQPKPKERIQKPRFSKHIYINSTASIHGTEPDYKNLITDANLRRRMSRVIKMGVACGVECLGDTPSEKIQAIITATGLGCLTDTERFLNAIIVQKEQLLNPTPFIQSTFNTIGAQIALLKQIRTYNMTYSHRAFSFESALLDGMMKIDEGNDNILVGAVDEITATSRTIQQRLGWLKEVRAGEGAQFFLLSNHPNDDTSAEICDVDTYSSHSSSIAISTRIQLLLERNGLTIKEVDWFIGEKSNIDFPHTTQSTFKEECGEYPTAIAYALWKVANALKDPEHPAKVVVICTNYHHKDQSIILIKKHCP